MADTTLAPDTMGRAQRDMAPKLEMFRDVLGGTAKMREKGESYLPKWQMEEPGAYRDRLAQSVFYNATELTLDALVGLVLRTDPELSKDIPQEIADDAENIDLGGRHMSVFAKDLFRDSWDGLACVLVDMQRVTDVRSRAEEQRAGLRPYWAEIKAQDILRARSVTINGNEVLGSFAYRETVTMEDGEFGERTEERVRDYRLDLSGAQPVVIYRVFAKRTVEGKEGWSVIEGPETLRISASEPMDEIPVSVCYTNRTGFMEAEPPLLDLAYENIDHYQQRSEHRKGWQYARIPIQVYPGMDPDEVVIAVDRGITTPSVDAKPYYMQTDSAALDGSKTELLESERRMSNLGAQMLFRPDKSNETATARRIENAQSTSRLANAARALQDCLEDAIRLHAKWRRVELPARTDGRWVTVNQDFADYEMGAQMIAALDNAVANGRLTNRSFLTALRDGVPLLSFLDPEAEDEMVGSDGLRVPELGVAA